MWQERGEASLSSDRSEAADLQCKEARSLYMRARPALRRKEKETEHRRNRRKRAAKREKKRRKREGVEVRTA